MRNYGCFRCLQRLKQSHDHKLIPGPNSLNSLDVPDAKVTAKVRRLLRGVLVVSLVTTYRSFLPLSPCPAAAERSHDGPAEAL